MNVQRTVTILLPDDPDVRATLDAFQRVQQALSAPAFNGGMPLRAFDLQRASYQQVKGTLNSQMTISAIRLVAGAYASAKSNKRPAFRPFAFRNKRALFLVGKRGRDADFRKDGTLSIWTTAGRKRIAYTVPAAFRATLAAAAEIDSLTVIERNGRLLGRVTLTLEAPDPAGVLPVGIDLNETNAIVAADPDGRILFVSGKAVKVANRRAQKTRSRLQRKLAARKAEKKDTRSVRRTLKRLGRKASNRTRTFAQTAAKQLVQWAPPNAVLVFEDLHIPQVSKRFGRSKALHRRLSLWQRGLIRQFAENKAELAGIAVATVDPAYTSQACSRCGMLGKRKRHRFVCPHCGHEAHSDENAALNIRNRYTALRSGGPLSTGPEARPSSNGEGAGKLAGLPVSS